MVLPTYSLKHGAIASILAQTFFTHSLSRHREEYLAPIPEGERQDLILAYHAQLNSVDDATRIKAAKAWSKWECVGDSTIERKLILIHTHTHAHIEWPHQSCMWIPRTWKGLKAMNLQSQYLGFPPLLSRDKV